MILTQGRNNDAFYIVAKGTVDVILPRPGQSDVIALQLGPGKYFGEMAFFHEHRNMASVRACENCQVEAAGHQLRPAQRIAGAFRGHA